MRLHQAPALALASLLAATPLALAKSQRVPVTPPANIVTDPSLAAFRAKLGEIAKARDLKALKGLVATGFFWQSDFGGGFDAHKTPLQNLTEALSLDDAKLGKEYKGSGWRRLQAIVASPIFVTGEHGGDQQGAAKAKAVCGPTAPSYNTDAIPDELVWGYVLGRVDARAKPAASSAIVGSLENEAVEVVEPADAEMGHADFAKVKLPPGKLGYVAASAIHGFLEEELCLRKTEECLADRRLRGRGRLTDAPVPFSCRTPYMGRSTQQPKGGDPVSQGHKPRSPVSGAWMLTSGEA